MQPAQVPPDPYLQSAPTMMHPPSSMPPGGMIPPQPPQPQAPVPQGPMLGVVNQQPSAPPPGMMQQSQVIQVNKFAFVSSRCL